MKTYSINFVVLAYLLAVTVFRCSSPVDIADGGASGTEIGVCKVHGEVTDSLGKPVAGSTVRLRPFDYIAGRNDSAVIRRDAVSDADGRFTLDSVPAGHYTVEGLSSDSFGQVLTCELDTLDSVSYLSPLKLQPLSIVSGIIPGLQPAAGQDFSVQVIGLEHSVPIDKNGNFVLRIPSGWSRLNLHGVDAEQPDYDTLVYFRPGENELTRPMPHKSHGCDSLVCELVILRELLDSSGLKDVPAESVIVVADNRIVEIHLRGRGLKVLPDPIGKFQRLRVLDIGENGLREVPRTIEFLRHLAELRADHNQLWVIPSSIGSLKELEIFDCSINKLQSLPETIVYLSPVQVDFAGNMLCNIGEQTRKWMDLHDPDWMNNQECR